MWLLLSVEGGVRLGDGLGLADGAGAVALPVVGSWTALRCIGGAILDGRVLLRCTPLNDDGVLGLAVAFEFREFLEDTDTFRRRLPYLRKLSAPPLALETERRMLV